MDNPQSDATRLNTEANKLFNEGKFSEAGKLYQAANKADTLKSPVYLSNLELVQLKLQQFPMAKISATMALLRDARFYKARYRRALARQKQGRLMEALVDLANVLTVEPLEKVAAAAFATISREPEDSGRSRGFLSPMSILKADYPSAYCAPRSNPDSVQQTSAGRPAGGIAIPNSSSRIPKALRLGTMQILIYAMRAIGALHQNNPPYLTVFLAFVKMVPLAADPSKRRRVSITNIVTVPLAVLEKDTKDSYTPAKEAANPSKGRTSIFMHRVVPVIVLMAKQSMLAIGFESHSFGTSPKVTTDLDELYWILEDELANDVDNYYGLQC
ncbi:hypothetical protein DFH09DRAFT_1305856 [Mycena vulgaris]|nr:hypothetical protein DFH09DRAFT_1305856 [Mycena vulgaris]